MTDDTKPVSDPGPGIEALADALVQASFRAGFIAGRRGDPKQEGDPSSMLESAARSALLRAFAESEERARRAIAELGIEKLNRKEERDSAEAAGSALRAAAQSVVDAYYQCREANSFQGFWTVLDDLAAELDGRANLLRAGCTCELGPSSSVPSQSCPKHGHGPIPGRK